MKINKDYTVVIVSFDNVSYFISWVSAESVDEARKLGVDYAQQETGIPDYECIACFGGCLKLTHTSDQVFDWRF
jgi:hypothetical protein